MLNELAQKNRAMVLMVSCAALWSIAGIFIKMIPWNPLVIAGARSLIASVVVAVYMAVKKIPFRVNKLSLLSGIMLSATFLAFVSANKLTTAANAIVLQYIAPVFIVLISTVLYKQRFRRSDYLVVAVTILGIALCFLDQLDAGSLLGNCVGVLSGLFMAFMFVFTGRADEASRMTGIFLGQLFTAIIGLPFIAVFDTPVTNMAVLNIVILGVFQLGIPYVLYGLAVEHCSPLVCSLVGAVEPLLNPLWVFLFNGEAPGFFALIGGLVVISNITAWCVWNDRKAVKELQMEESGRG